MTESSDQLRHVAADLIERAKIHGVTSADVLVAEGDSKAMEKTTQLFESIKGEPSLAIRKGICETCTPASPVQPKDYKMEATDPRCRFEKKKEADLPKYLQNR